MDAIQLLIDSWIVSSLAITLKATMNIHVQGLVWTHTLISFG